MNEPASRKETEEEIFDPALEEDEGIGTAVRYTISSYGADYPVDGLVSRINRGDIYVPDFQRGYVWTQPQASRFVESLLLGLPVPGIFLFKEPDTQKLVVVDGQQRLRTLSAFYEGIFKKKEFELAGVCDELEGLTSKTLREEDRRRLDDAIVHATIFQQDSPGEDRSSIYLVFERLNTGGTPLAPQEIRSCVSRGELNELLRELASHEKWQEIYGPPNPRGKDQELILRFFALYYAGEKYARPMKTFLNTFMQERRNPGSAAILEMRQHFERVVETAAAHLTRASFRPERSLNAAVLDALLVGLGRRLAAGPIDSPEKLLGAAQSLLSNEDFVAAISSSTTNEDSIERRLAMATEALKAVP